MISESIQKVSIVIPAYNCGSYIKKCVESLLNQTYRNIEVIVVNDGSTDDTQGILAEVAKQDDRVIVINKMNEGVARARNKGGKKATGEYIMFVDGDDFVSDTYVETMLTLLMKYQADMAICNLQTFYDEPDISPRHKVQKKEKVYNNVEALEKLLYRDTISSSPCNKIMKREIFLKYPFPENTLYEDFGIVYRWLADSNTIVHTSEKLYYYLLRQGSAQHSKFRSQKMDLYKLSEEILEYVKENFPVIIDAAYNRMFVSCLQLLRDIPVNDFEAEYNLLKMQIKFLRKKVLFDKKSRRSTRILALGCYTNIYVLKTSGFLLDKLVFKFKIKKAF